MKVENVLQAIAFLANETISKYLSDLNKGILGVTEGDRSFLLLFKYS